MDLEDELKRLFKDERLDVRVAPEAESNVVAGASRLRRRRMVTMSAAGVLSAAMLAGGALVLTQSSPQSSGVATQPSSDLPIDSTQPTSVEPRPESTATTAPGPSQYVTSSPNAPLDPPGTTKATGQPPTARLGVVLGPTGDGTIRLGDTQKELSASGRVPTTVKEPVGCSSLPTKSATGTAYIGQSGKVVALVYRAEATTPEDITIGSPADSVKATYRDFTGSTVSVPGNPGAKYKFTFASGKITSIALLANQQDCVG